ERERNPDRSPESRAGSHPRGAASSIDHFADGRKTVVETMEKNALAHLILDQVVALMPKK
ncbi:MAG: hypothetical protein R6W95_12510, partial [Desulfosarcina sp.]